MLIIDLMSLCINHVAEKAKKMNGFTLDDFLAEKKIPSKKVHNYY